MLRSNADLLPECARDHEATTRVQSGVWCSDVQEDEARTENKVQFYFISVDSSWCILLQPQSPET